MLRLTGLILIFFSCALTGFILSGSWLARCEELEALARLSEHIRARIAFCRAPMEEILVGYRDERLEANGFLPALREAARRGNGFEEAAMECRKLLRLFDSEREELERFLGGLGRHDADREVEQLAEFAERFRRYASEARADYPKKSRLCRTFGLLGGGMLALMLL